jgi:hypothetical protein
MDVVQELTPQHRGRYLVTSQGSSHVFDLDAGTYERRPGQGRQAFAHDVRTLALTRVDEWPSVGGMFLIWFDDPDRPDELGHWRQSSIIRSIEALPPCAAGAADVTPEPLSERTAPPPDGCQAGSNIS